MDLKIMGAVTVLMNRMQGLSKEDRIDLDSAFGCLVWAGTQEERDAAAITVAEIIENKPVELRRLV